MAATFVFSHLTYYTWLRHYEKEGLKGLEGRSSAPHHMPTAALAEVAKKILGLHHQHHFGPEKILMYPQHYHGATISVSSGWRSLHKAGISRLPASQRYKRKETRWNRYEKQRACHQLLMDVKFIEPIGQTG
ncbi:leucine zipper domain-containing protein [Kocuria rosea]|uniref:leucine zipper domain-containing protein n=1 Tax=Kocuria rosea TaxID=1275 RepID=UPI0011A96578|nr:leucine zipper domain-containing protein [Kocuria rosea]